MNRQLCNDIIQMLCTKVQAAMEQVMIGNALSKCTLSYRMSGKCKIVTNINPHPLYSDTPPLPSARASPCPCPKRHSNPHADRHCPECRRIAMLTITQNIFWIPLDPRVTALCSILVDGSVNGAPECSSCGRRNSQNTPVCSEILDTPYNRDDDGG